MADNGNQLVMPLRTEHNEFRSEFFHDLSNMCKVGVRSVFRRRQYPHRTFKQRVDQADDDGRACGKCDSCRLRAEGFAAAGVSDPTPYF